MTTFRKGDVCTIEVVIESVYGTGIRIRHVDSYTDIHVKPKDLTMVRPKLEVGDWVEWKVGDKITGRVIAIADDHLWVYRDHGEFSTVWTGLVTRIDPEPKPAAITATESTYVAMQIAMSGAEEQPPIPDMEPRVPRFDGEVGEAE